jgi:phospholipase/carboxylesterase
MDFIHVFTPGRLPVTVLLLHGSGGDENDLLPVAKALVPGAAFLSPRGNVVQHGTRRFFSYPGPDGFDPEEVTERVAELAD